MRLALVLSFLVAPTLSAAISFDPPNPTSATPVVAHVAVQATFCPPTPNGVTRNGSTISITLNFPPCPILAPPSLTPIDVPVSLGRLPAGVYDVVANGTPEHGTLVVRDAVPPFDVVPNVVTTSGGEIHLRSNVSLIACAVGPSPVVCQTFAVRIGGATAKATLAATNDIVVVVPPHAAGAVDVTLERGAETLTATAALDYYVPDQTPDLAFFEPVVFPALLTGAGAFGSQWTTDVALRSNFNTVPGLALPIVPAFFDSVPAVASVTVTGANVPPGMVLYVARQFAPRVFFNVIARDLSKQSEAFGTEIPVVREKDLYDRPFDILQVPTDPRFRVALRVFRTDGGQTAHLRIFAFAAVQPLVDAEVSLTPGPFGYSSLNMPDLVQSIPQLAGKGPLRIEIDGETGRRVISALVSVTNNSTQHVTVIAPH
ncbi:MAG TPA: hypothetical protein VJZ76_23930 [Thermoanaerobaculia bacterium]|nr:hypothetical protein [Thermoanaerobaculia bacterium]